MRSSLYSLDNVVNIGNVRVNNVTMNEAITIVEKLVKLNVPSYVNCVNADAVVRYNKDPCYAQFYDGGRLCVADSQFILMAASFLGTPIREKISGSDFVINICRLANSKGFKLFFLGGQPASAMRVKEVLRRRFGISPMIATYCPPYDFYEYEHEKIKIRNLIVSARPDIVFVGMGSPRRERWIAENCNSLGVSVFVGVGAAFEWISGRLKRAPGWIQRMGLEWFWRVLQEPNRLWRRYFIDDLPFFSIIWKQKFRKPGFKSELDVAGNRGKVDSH